MTEEEKKEIVRTDSAVLYIPVNMGIGGPQIGTASIHRSEEGEVWLTADLPHTLFEKNIQCVSIIEPIQDVNQRFLDGLDFSETAVISSDPHRPGSIIRHLVGGLESREQLREMKEQEIEDMLESNKEALMDELLNPEKRITRTHESGLPDGPHIFPKETP